VKLYWSSRSPFVRKVMVVAHEAGLVGRIDCVRAVVSAAKPNPEVMAENPLGKLPTLVVDGVGPIYDSRVICEYLDGLHDGPKLFPVGGPERLAALRRQALGDGIMDFLLLWLGERNRPAEQQSARHIDGFRLKLAKSADALEREVGALAENPFGIGHIALGCALSYADFRFADENWRAGRPRLADWHAQLARRPSVQATEHVDTY
jgi:glutathione S-transferase